MFISDRYVSKTGGGVRGRRQSTEPKTRTKSCTDIKHVVTPLISVLRNKYYTTLACWETGFITTNLVNAIFLTFLHEHQQHKGGAKQQHDRGLHNRRSGGGFHGWFFWLVGGGGGCFSAFLAAVSVC